MADPIIAERKPRVLNLEPGEYWWCACGRSKNQPFCDGSHSGTGISPMQFTITEPKLVSLCCCKHTNNKPYCDGTHSKLPE